MIHFFQAARESPAVTRFHLMQEPPSVCGFFPASVTNLVAFARSPGHVLPFVVAVAGVASGLSPPGDSGFFVVLLESPMRVIDF